MITLRTPSLRQSAAGKSRVSETQISIFAPTARSVNCSKYAPPEAKSISGQNFFVPTGGLSAAAAATPARAVALLIPATGLVAGILTFASPTSITSPPDTPASAVVGTMSASAATASAIAALLTASSPVE